MPFSYTALITPAIRLMSTVISFVTSRLERQYWGYVFLKWIGYAKLKNDFSSIYITTIYNLINEKGKNRQIIKLFEVEAVKNGFQKELYEKNNWAFIIPLDDNLHTNPSFKVLKKINVSIDKEIDDFREEFRRLVNLTRQPKEIETHEKLNSVAATTSSIEATLNEIKEKYNIPLEIKHQLIFTESEVSPLVNNLSNRKETIIDLAEIFEKKQILFLTGSIATGKTQLAALFYNNEFNNNERYWVSLRATDSNDFLLKIIYVLSTRLKIEVKNVLHDVINQILQRIPKESIIILDDLPKLDSREAMSKSFVLLINGCINKKIRVLATSNHELPLQIRDLLKANSVEYKPVPLFSEEETKEVLISYGATESQADEFKLIVHVVSSGHPIIVSAIAKFLHLNQWDIASDKINLLFGNDYSSELTESTYDNILGTIEDAKTRELLYRLNIVKGSFSDDVIKLVAQIDPEISTSQERFHSIIGLWVQRSTSSLYELSPLIKRLNNDNLNSIVIQKINYTLGQNILAKKKLNQFEAKQAIGYFLAAKSYNDAGFVLVLVLSESINHPDLFFDWGFNLYWTTGQLPSQMDILLRLAIRHQQIMILLNKNMEISYLRGDLENIMEEAERKGLNIAVPALLLSNLYSHENSSKSIKYYLSGMKGIDTLRESEKYEKAISKIFIPEELIWTSIRAIKNENDINEWFNAFEKLSEQQRKQSIKADISVIGSAILIYNLIKEEENREVKDWLSFVSVLERISIKARELGLEILYAHSIKSIIEILTEKLNRLTDAKNLADKELVSISKAEPDTEFLIKDAIGRQLFYQGKNTESLLYISDAVTIETIGAHAEKLDTFLVMSQLLGVKDQKSAHFYIQKSLELANTPGRFSDVLKAKIIAEFAVSLALNNDVKGAIYKMEEGYSILLQAYSNTNDYKILTIRYGHILNYWYSIHCKGKTPEDIDGEPYEKPSRGYFFVKYTNEFVDKHWYDERPFILTQILLGCFEEIGDLTLAKKWAFNSVDVNKSFVSNVFGHIIQRAVPYLILDDKYDEAINCQVLTIRGINSFDEKVEEIKNERLKKAIMSRPKGKITVMDELILAGAILPITLHLVTMISDEKAEVRNHIQNAIKALIKWSEVFTDKDCIQKVIELFKMVDSDVVDDVKLLKHSQEYNGSMEDHVKTVGYLLASCYSNTIQAFQLHIAFIKTLESTIRIAAIGAYPFLFIPFLEAFWFNRYKRRNGDFKSHDFWKEKSIPFYYGGSLNNKAKRMFQILCLHLNVKPSAKLEEWMEE